MSHHDETAKPLAKPLTAAQPNQSRHRWRWIGLACGFGLLIAGLFLISQVKEAREAARFTSCRCKLCFIGLAFANFEATESVLPMAIASKVPVSWRVRLLPYTDQAELAASYDLDNTWNAEVNRPITRTLQESYECPNLSKRRNAAAQGFTSYAMLDGDDFFSSAKKLSDVTDGLSQTLAVVEASGLHIPWAEPRDVDTKRLQPGFESWQPERVTSTWLSSTHNRGAVVTYADGRSGAISPKIDPIVLRQLATIAGGEKLPPEFRD